MQMETPAVRACLSVVLNAKNGISTPDVCAQSNVGLKYVAECLCYLKKQGAIGHLGSGKGARWASPERTEILRAEMVKDRKAREYAANRARLKRIGRANERAAAEKAQPLRPTGPRSVFELGAA